MKIHKFVIFVLSLLFIHKNVNANKKFNIDSIAEVRVYIVDFGVICTFGYLNYRDVISQVIQSNKNDPDPYEYYIKLSNRKELFSIQQVLAKVKFCGEYSIDSMDARVVLDFVYRDQKHKYFIIGSQYTPFINMENQAGSLSMANFGRLLKIIGINKTPSWFRYYDNCSNIKKMIYKTE